MKKLVKVVGAVIENDNNEILCALRSPEMSLPNMWEFPGGKVGPNEELAVVIVREIKEKLQCDIECIGVFNNNIHIGCKERLLPFIKLFCRTTYLECLKLLLHNL